MLAPGTATDPTANHSYTVRMVCIAGGEAVGWRGGGVEVCRWEMGSGFVVT